MENFLLIGWVPIQVFFIQGTLISYLLRAEITFTHEIVVEVYSQSMFVAFPAELSSESMLMKNFFLFEAGGPF